MDSAVLNLLEHGFSMKLFLQLIGLMIAFLVVLGIKDFLTSLYEYRKFKGSMDVGRGTWIRLPTPVGHVDGQITQANRSHVVVDTIDTRIHLPMKSFRERDWILLKRDAFPDDTDDEEPVSFEARKQAIKDLCGKEL